MLFYDKPQKEITFSCFKVGDILRKLPLRAVHYYTKRYVLTECNRVEVLATFHSPPLHVFTEFRLLT